MDRHTVFVRTIIIDCAGPKFRRAQLLCERYTKFYPALHHINLNKRTKKIHPALTTHFKFSSNRTTETLISTQRTACYRVLSKICETDKFCRVYIFSLAFDSFNFPKILSSQFWTKMKIAISVVDQIYLDSFPKKKFCERSRVNLNRKEFLCRLNIENIKKFILKKTL